MARFAGMGALLIVAMVLCMSVDLGSAQAPAPAPDCTSVIVELLPCLPFLSNDSVPSPTTDCCGNLTAVSVSSPVCLCQFTSPAYANQSAALGVNATRALELPTFCSLNISPGNCSAVVGGGPVAAPSPSPLSPLVPAPVPAISSPVPSIPSPVPAPMATAPAPAVPVATPTPTSSPTPTPSASGPAAGCSLPSLATCLQFVEGTVASPPSTCCTSLGSTSPACLCTLVNSAGSAISAINVTLALELPNLCGVNVPLDSLSCLAGIASPPTEAPSGTPGTGSNSATGGAALSQGSIALLVAVIVFILQH